MVDFPKFGHIYVINLNMNSLLSHLKYVVPSLKCHKVLSIYIMRVSMHMYMATKEQL